MRTRFVILVFFAVVVSCNSRPEPAPHIDGNAVKAHIQKLASDEMEGRAPATKGEELATAYIADFYKSIGLKTQFQEVPMIGITSKPSPLRLTGKGGTKELRYGDDFMAWTRREDA